MILYDHVDARGANTIKEWTLTFGPREWAAIRNKLAMLQRVDDPSHLPGLWKGPGIQGQQEISKLWIGASGKGRALRPMVCRGPIDKKVEVTLLHGAEEKGGHLPAGVAKKAEEHRRHIIADQKRRTPHEPVTGRRPDDGA